MKNSATKRRVSRERRKKHIRKKISGTPECPRLTVFRSLNNISVQVIDDTNNMTLASVSSISKALKAKTDNAKSKVETAKIVGLEIGKIAKEKKIEKVVFDRNGYLYHGRVKAVADGARESGLKF